MKKRVLFGLAAGIAALTAVAVTVNKVSKDLRDCVVEDEVNSPLGNNWIKISLGPVSGLKDVTYVKIQADTDSNEDVCKLMIFMKSGASLYYEWKDNEHFSLLAGDGKVKQCCDVSFDIKNITMKYYPIKI